MKVGHDSSVFAVDTATVALCETRAGATSAVGGRRLPPLLLARASIPRPTGRCPNVRVFLRGHCVTRSCSPVTMCMLNYFKSSFTCNTQVSRIFSWTVVSFVCTSCWLPAFLLCRQLPLLCRLPTPLKGRTSRLLSSDRHSQVSRDLAGL